MILPIAPIWGQSQTHRYANYASVSNLTIHQNYTMKQIAQSLVKAQKEFGPALKTSTNPHFKSRYADLSNCIEAVIDALNNNGIALIQQTHEDQTGVTVETMFLHESGESLTSGKLHVPAAKNDPQGYGSALTYARRYSLMAACGIAPEDDDGNAASKPKMAKLNEKQIQEISNLVNETDTDFAAFMHWVSKAVGAQCSSLNQVPADAFDPIIRKLNTKKVSA